MDEQVKPPIERTADRTTIAPAGRRRLWPWLIVLLVVIGVAIWHPWSRHAATTGAVTAPIPVAVATATKGSMPVVLTELGTVTPLATITVQSQISGYLQSVDFTEGQDVDAGTLLALIDPRPYEATLEQYEAQLAHDLASWQQAKMDLARYQTLGKQQSIAKQTLEDQVYTVAQDAATLKVDQAEIDTQKLDIAYCHVRSPVAGRVGLRQIDAGNYVTSSETNGLVVVTQIKPISVIFTVAEDNIQPILLRMQQTGTPIEVDGYDRTDQIKIASGKLETIDNQVDTSTGTVKLRATFPNDDERLFPNEFVNAHLLLDTEQNVVLVPNAAIQTGPNGSFVYQVVPLTADEIRRNRAAARLHHHAGGGGGGGSRHRNGGALALGSARDKVVVRVIKTGHSDGTNTVVSSGLAAGVQVVTDGIDRLKDNAPVVLTSGQGGAGEGKSAAKSQGAAKQAGPTTAE